MFVVALGGAREWHYDMTLLRAAVVRVCVFWRGWGGCRDTYRIAKRVPDLVGKRIVEVACGAYHTVSLDVYGRVYPFGRYGTVIRYGTV